MTEGISTANADVAKMGNGDRESNHVHLRYPDQKAGEGVLYIRPHARTPRPHGIHGSQCANAEPKEGLLHSYFSAHLTI